MIISISSKLVNFSILRLIYLKMDSTLAHTSIEDLAIKYLVPLII